MINLLLSSDEDSYDLLAAEKERIKKERELEKKLRV